MHYSQGEQFEREHELYNELYIEGLEKIKETKLGEIFNLPLYQIDIPHTIPQLSYLTHNFYRYYGKYPSLLANYLINKYTKKDGIIFDNYLGCGTTLVEAKLKGFHSSGIDINPIAILASNVKTRTDYDSNTLFRYLEDILAKAKDIRIINDDYLPDMKDIDKWFSKENQTNLCKIKQSILSDETNNNREFASLCFLSIVRRCSNAFDGEVRPHINREKKPRDAFSAFHDKFKDMVNRQKKFLDYSDLSIRAEAYCASNLESDLKKYMPYGSPSLIISHPPYLNCFNYYAVFNLENRWAKGIYEAELNKTTSWIRENEQICWPATNTKILNNYYENLKLTYRNLRRNIKKGAVLCIIIGDATLRKTILHVQEEVISFLPTCGFKPYEIIYRTTNYGIGKYAYQHRADYHGDAQKKDGVIVSIAI